MVESGLPMRLPAALIALVLAVLVLPGPARAGYRIGISEQNRAMFASPAWQRLGLVRTRYLVAWDWEATGQQAEIDAYMRAARAAGQDVLVTFTAHRGCFNGRRYGREPYCRAPSARAFRAAFRRFDDRYPWVRTYAGWNEVNHVSQPTFARPRLAVRYYRVLRSERRRRGFRVLAADLLDTANLLPYLRAFRRLAPGRPRLWGLHNYQDVNRGTAGDTRRMLRAVRGAGVADRDERDREVRRQPPVPLLGGARGAAHALDVPDRGALRRAPAAASRADLAAVRLPVVRGAAGRALRRRRRRARRQPSPRLRGAPAPRARPSLTAYRPPPVRPVPRSVSVKEEELVSRVTDLLREAGVEEPVVAAGIFNPRGHSGGMFAGGLAGDSVGGAFGGLGSSIGTAGGALAGAKANDAASGLPEWLVLAVTEASVVGFDTDGRRRPTAPIFRLERTRLETKVHQRVNVRVLELIDRETGARIELEGNRIPTLHTGPVLDALKD